jgi:molybdopterin/thiamine biosynthesis adenylyltransferase
MQHWYPRVKPEHQFWKLDDTRIRLGGNIYGVAAEIIDQRKLVWSILNAADGHRSMADTARHVASLRSDITESEVFDVLTELAEAGFLENAAAPDPPSLNDSEKERYERSRQFYRWITTFPVESSWEPQVKLKQRSVVVVGVGGTGGAAALALAASGVGRLHCIDSDVVELSNLNRQVLYTEADIGKPKAHAARSRLAMLNSHIEITSEQRHIHGPDDFHDLAEEFDVVVMCADKPADIGLWANDACLRSGTPWVSAGYHGPVASAMAFVPGAGACNQCVRKTDEREGVWQPLDDKPGTNAITAPAAGMSGNLAAHLCTAIITGIPTVVPGRLQGVNLFDAEHHFVKTYDRRPDCDACGNANFSS